MSFVEVRTKKLKYIFLFILMANLLKLAKRQKKLQVKGTRILHPSNSIKFKITTIRTPVKS